MEARDDGQGEHPEDEPTMQYLLRIIEQKPYGCPGCRARFKNLEELRRHANSFDHSIRGRLTEEELKKLKCPVCWMDFPRQDVLQDHYVKMHTVPKPYVCGHCDKRFEKKENLEQHVRIHTGERPYKCNVCDRSFRQSSNLAQHKRIHNRKGLKRRSSELPSSDAEGGPAQFRRREIKIEPTPGLLQSRVLVNRQGAGQMGNSARVSPWANHMNHIPASPGQEAQHSTSVTSSESYINQVISGLASGLVFHSMVYRVKYYNSTLMTIT
ncbi:hypothetical protein AAMO2058_001569200 [Amorphochlora amoebiformis]